jgi:hypothetical protein
MIASKFFRSVAVGTVAGLLLGATGCAERQAPVTPEEARAIAADAYVFAWPHVDNYRAMYRASIDSADPGFKASFNRIANVARVFGPEDRIVTTPNSDTPYSWLYLDLRGEPMVLTLPEIEPDRYYSVQLVDMHTFNVGYLGTRTTGNGGGQFLVAGPLWAGPTPGGIDTVIHSDTDYMLALYRTQLFGPGDLEAVQVIQSGYQVQPLSALLGRTPPIATPPVAWPLPTSDMMDTPAIFSYLDALLPFAPALPSEEEMMDRFARIGVAPGETFDLAAFPPAIQRAIRDGVLDGQQRIDALAARVAAGELNSTELFGTRAFLGDHYPLYSAVGAKIGLYGNSKDEAYYPVYFRDAQDEPLDASLHRYTLTFPQDGLPPARAFWSLTMYDATSQLLVANPIHRYLINSAMLPDLVRGPDGSVTIYVQRESPGAAREPNWLPAPDGAFFAVLRLYLPEPAAFDGSWPLPKMEQAGDAAH